MAVNKIRRNGSFAPLSAHAYKDDALARAGEAAELLFYRGLSFNADVLQDGFISDIQLARYVGAGMANAAERADALVAVGLWERWDGGYNVRSWLKWNNSKEEITGKLEKDSGRKRSGDGLPEDPFLIFDMDPADSDEGTQGELQLESERNPNGGDGPSTYTSTSISTSRSTYTSTSSPSSTFMREQFDRFWQVYPKRQQRAVAERAFVHAVYGVKGKKRPPTSPEVIIRGAMAYASAQHGVEDRFVALASTWLNQSRWTDEHHDRPPLRAISGGYQPFQNPADQSAYDEPI